MSVALVVPCFNEASRWNSTYWKEMLASVPAQFLFVDDGSRDATRERILDTITGMTGGYLHLPSNRGKAEAVRVGMLELLADHSFAHVGFLDAAGGYCPNDVNRVMTCLE